MVRIERLRHLAGHFAESELEAHRAVGNLVGGADTERERTGKVLSEIHNGGLYLAERGAVERVNAISGHGLAVLVGCAVIDNLNDSYRLLFRHCEPGSALIGDCQPALPVGLIVNIGSSRKHGCDEDRQNQ